MNNPLGHPKRVWDNVKECGAVCNFCNKSLSLKEANKHICQETDFGMDKGSHLAHSRTTESRPDTNSGTRSNAKSGDILARMENEFIQAAFKMGYKEGKRDMLACVEQEIDIAYNNAKDIHELYVRFNNKLLKFREVLG